MTNAPQYLKDLSKFYTTKAERVERPADPRTKREIKRKLTELAQVYDSYWKQRLERAKEIHKNADKYVIVPDFDSDVDLVMWAETEPPYEGEVI